MDQKFNRTLVTAALPYANGPLHIGHIAGCYLPSDIYVRCLRSLGRDVKFICGSDEHGVPITIKAKKENVSPQQIVDKYHAMMKSSFEEFGISFDIYSRTSSKIHHETASEFFEALYKKNSFTEQEKCWLTLVFEVKNLHKNKQLDKQFIFIENSNINSLDDNWYLADLAGNTLKISLLIPFEMQSNQDYIEFLNKRITEMINDRIVTLSIIKMLKSFTLPADGFFSYRAKLRQTRQTALVPGFYFWKQNKVNSYLNNLLKSKTAKNDPNFKKGLLP